MSMFVNSARYFLTFLFVVSLLLIVKLVNGFIFVWDVTSKIKKSKEDKFVTFTDLASSYGYPHETHRVVTSDGYILMLHRIPASPKSPERKNKPAIMYLQGFLCASDFCLIGGPDRDLTLMLADVGYDVWLLNVRGNFYSRKHRKFCPETDKQYWNFSMHEMGIFDLPATVDYILEKTNRQKLSIIGYSMGGLISFVFLSTRKEYNDKVGLNVCFAPVCSFNDHIIGGPLNYFLVNLRKETETVLGMFGICEILPRSRVLNFLYKLVYKIPPLDLFFRKLTIFFIGVSRGSPSNIMSTKFAEKLLQHYPQGSSLKALLNYLELQSTGRFAAPNLGSKGNLAKYGTSEPPAYPLSEIKAPTYIFYGTNDGPLRKEDVAMLLKSIPNSEAVALKDTKFGHLDFMYHENIVNLLNNDVIALMNRYNHKT